MEHLELRNQEYLMSTWRDNPMKQDVKDLLLRNLKDNEKSSDWVIMSRARIVRTWINALPTK